MGIDAGRYLLHRQSIAGALGAVKSLGWTPSAIIDIGVAMGTEGLYDVWPAVPLVLVDPADENRPYMDRIAATYERVTVFQVGASDTCGELQGRVRPELGHVVVGIGFQKQGWESRTFPVLTCDEIVRQAGISGPFVLKIDTDSHERAVLAGAGETLRQTEVVIIECGLYNAMKGKFPAVELFATLAAAGFSLSDVAGTSYISATGVLRSLDLVFVKVDGEVMRLSYAGSQKNVAVKTAKRLEQRAHLLSSMTVAGHPPRRPE